MAVLIFLALLFSRTLSQSTNDSVMGSTTSMTWEITMISESMPESLESYTYSTDHAHTMSSLSTSSVTSSLTSSVVATTAQLLSSTASATSISTMISSTLVSSSVVLPTSAAGLESLNLTDLFVGSDDCSCDLGVGSCDVDCCCDGDCSDDEVTAFSSCSNYVTENRTPYCISSAAIFRSSLSDIFANSQLFCVYQDNYPGRSQFDTPTFSTNQNSINDALSTHATTGDILATPPSFNPLEATTYQSGNPLIVSYDNGPSEGYLPLPVPLNGEACHDDNPVTYLKEETHSCVRYLNPDTCTTSAFNVSSYFQDISVYSLPPGANSSSMIAVTLGNITCLDINGEPRSCDSHVIPVLDGNACNNTLVQLNYAIVHNGTLGVVTVTVDVVTRDAYLGPVEQTFSVEYSYINATMATDLRRSGIRGYEAGSFVLGGVYMESEGRVNVSARREEWLSVISGGGDGGCSRRASVLYKEDMKTSCILNVPVSDIQSDCPQLTNQIITLLLGNPRADRIGIYGNSNSSDVTEWIPIIVDDLTPSTDCSAIVTGVQVIILYSFTGEVSTAQSIITGATLRYITQDITDMCTGSHCTSISSLPVILDVTVTFVPTYTPPSEVLKSLTMTTRTLPEDFLYPLLRGANTNAARSSWLPPSLLSLILITSLIYYIS